MRTGRGGKRGPRPGARHRRILESLRELRAYGNIPGADAEGKKTFIHRSWWQGPQGLLAMPASQEESRRAWSHRQPFFSCARCEEESSQRPSEQGFYLVKSNLRVPASVWCSVTAVKHEDGDINIFAIGLRRSLVCVLPPRWWLGHASQSHVDNGEANCCRLVGRAPSLS